MQKQCTNSACRKFFTLSASGADCPWCGKQYPRTRIAAPCSKAEKRLSKPVNAPVSVSQVPSAPSLLLMNYGSNKICTIKAVHMLLGIGLADCKAMVDRTVDEPFIAAICHPEKMDEARKHFKAVGASFRFISGGRIID